MECEFAEKVWYLAGGGSWEPSAAFEVQTAVTSSSETLDRVPAHPDAPGVPFPPVAEDAFDAELEAIAEARVASSRRVAVFARIFAIVAACALAYALRWDLRYAMASHAAVDLGANPSAAQLDGASHALVSIDGVPGGVGAVDYRRPLGDSMYRLAPLVDHPDVFVELRLPDGVDPTRFIPPTTVRGRLVPMDEGGARFASARSLIAQATGRPPPARAWILQEGAEPSWASAGAILAVLALLLAAVQVVTLVTPTVRRRGR